MRKKVRIFSAIICISVFLILSLIIYGEFKIPSELLITENTKPLFGKIFSIEENLWDNPPEEGLAVNLSPKDIIRPDSSVSVKLFGTFPVKNTQLKKTDRQYVVPSGEIIGIKIYSSGLMVVGADQVSNENGIFSPASEAGIIAGDTIISVNGKEVTQISVFTEIVEKSDGESISVELQRKDKMMTLQLKPVLAQYDGKYKAGLWLRDSCAGIGTMTFYNSFNGIFAGLGHAVCDVDTLNVVPISTGSVLTAEINGCYKAENKVTGELCGVFGSEDLGELMINGSSGIYGVLTKYDKASDPLPAATRSEIKLGPAQIISTVDGEGPKYYDIEIVKINLAAEGNEKNMTIEIKDEKLIEKTGGIVQGMSGSPIIQNGMFIGAVTHVFLNNPLQGYGIFAENMLSTSDALYSDIKKEAA